MTDHRNIVITRVLDAPRERAFKAFGAVFADLPPMTAERLIVAGLVNHIGEHVGSIQKTIGS